MENSALSPDSLELERLGAWVGGLHFNNIISNWGGTLRSIDILN